MSQKIKRRKFLQLSGFTTLAGIAAGLGALYYVTQVEPAWIDVREVRLPLRRLDPAFNGTRLVQISDLHMGGWMNAARLKRIVQLALAQKPDAVLLTGDYLIGRGWSNARAGLLAEMTECLRPLAEACPVVSVLGNHDYWANPAAIRAALAQAGAVDLSNTVYSLHKDGSWLHLAGVDDIYEGHDDLGRVLDQLPADGAAVLLAHEPDFADVSAASGRFDLQISGHTHGGQVVLPFVGPPKLPWYGKKYPSGLYCVGEMVQYTNRGLGMGRLGVRFNCRPELTVFVLEA